MNKSKIEWCDFTWNPVTGCLHKCSYCYARKIANRFSKNTGFAEFDRGKPDIHVVYEEEYCGDPYPWKFEPTLHRYRLCEPIKKKKPSKIFVCSMADLFGVWVPDEWIKQVFDTCKAAPQHTYYFLTKNPERYFKVFSAWDSIYHPEKYKNWWFGATATTKEELDKSGCVLSSFKQITKGINVFVSIEPLIYFSNEYPHIVKWLDWVIIGAETGNRKDKVVPERSWIENIVNACQALNTPVFLKDNLNAIWRDNHIQEWPEGMQTTQD